MLSQVHKVTPQCMVQLFEYAMLLVVAFKTTISEMIGYVFQSIVFPIIEFIYNTLAAFNIQDILTCNSCNNNNNNNSNNNKNSFLRMNSSEMYSQRNEYMKDSYCGSSFDGTSTTVNATTNNNSENMSDFYTTNSEMPTRRTPPNNNNNNNNDESAFDEASSESSNDSSNGSSSSANSNNSDVSSNNSYKERLLNNVNGLSKHVKAKTAEIHDTFQVSLNGMKKQVFNKYNNNKNTFVGKWVNWSINQYNYVKNEYIMYYYIIIIEFAEHPIDTIKNYYNQKKEALVGYLREWYEFILNWIAYFRCLISDNYEELVEIFGQIKNGRFDYWQAVWSIANFIQQSLISLLKSINHKSFLAKTIIFFDLLGKLQAVKTYAKGPEIHHQKKY